MWTPHACTAVLALAGFSLPWSAPQAAWSDPSPHRVEFVTVAKGVRLEVLDWGGSGQPIVLLSGLGNTAHVFDDFATAVMSIEAPAGAYHVYAITRRGYGDSSAPVSGYTASHLADDVLAVLDSLKIVSPVLVGHSIAGEEMSALAARHPDRVAGLVYLDAAYDRTDKSLQAMTKKVTQPTPGAADLASVQALRDWMTRALGVTVPEAEIRHSVEAAPDGHVVRFRTPPWVAQAIMAGVQKPNYARIRAPALAIYAVPRSAHDVPGYADSEASRAAFEELYQLMVRQQAADTKRFEGRVAHGRVLNLSGAHHYVFLSNEADVLRELRAFIASLG